MSLRYYAQALRKHWISILVSAVLGVIAAIGITAAMKPTYEAEATGLVHLNSATSQQSSTYAQNLVQSFPSYVHSPDVLRTTINTLHLDTSVHQLSQKVSASNPPGTFNLTVQASAGTARDAQRIANQVADSLSTKIESLESDRSAPPSGGGTATSQSVTVNFAVPATLPMSPSSPRPALNLALGLLIGLAVGICVAIIRDQLDTTIKTIEDLRTLSGATPLGTIRYDAEFRSHPLVSMHTRSWGIEDFRTIRTNLQFVDVDNPPRQIVISSAIANEGKSVAACNIATTLAQADLRVCLVEGDLRRPRVTSYLGLDGAVGLTDVAAGTHSLDDALISWQHGRITVLPAGTTPPDPAHFLGSKATSTLLTELRDKYDVVIIDAPPLLPVSDAAVVGAMSDGVILVARYRHVRRDQFAAAIDTLAKVNAKLLGSVLTHSPVRRQHFRYGEYASYRQPSAAGGKRLGLRGRQEEPRADAERHDGAAATKTTDSATSTSTAQTQAGSGAGAQRKNATDGSNQTTSIPARKTAGLAARGAAGRGPTGRGPAGRGNEEPAQKSGANLAATASARRKGRPR